MKAPKTCVSHFSSHWLPWLALHHMLSATDLREVLCGMVHAMSRGESALSDLFDEKLTDSGLSSENWVLTPKEVTTPLATYLQRRIRLIVWSNDATVYFDNKADWDGIPAHPSLIEAIVRLGHHPSPELCAKVSTEYDLAKHSGLASVLRCIEITSHSKSHNNASAYADALEIATTDLDMPLRMAALKFAGDQAAMEDRWSEAKTIYERVLSGLAQDNNPAWQRAVSGLTTITAQSLANASRIVKGKKSASEVFDHAHDQWPAIDPILFSLNSTHTSLNVRTTQNNFPHDNRTSSLNTPLIISNHNLEQPTLDFLERDYSRANQLFQARLRRQLSLGSNEEARVTQALYARNIMALLASTLSTEKNHSAFAAATHLLIQSGFQKLVSTIDWDKDLIDTYVDVALIDSLHEQYAAFEGTREERHLVTVELLSGWAAKLSSSKKEVGTAILQLLGQFAKNNEVTSYTPTNIGGSSLKALKEIAQRHPDWLDAVSTLVANALVTRLLAEEWWTGQQLAAEVALAYAAAFTDEDLASLVHAAVKVLGQTRSDVWVVIRPLQDFITSAPSRKFIRSQPDLEREVIELLIRHGTDEQANEQANLVHYLRAFDARLLDAPDLRAPLQGIVEAIKENAKTLNSTVSQPNIQALLSAPGLAGPEGLNVALDSVRQILESVESASYNISLDVAYYPILQIAVEHEQIAAGTGISGTELLERLSPLFHLLEKFWLHAARDPSIFMPFSIPQKHVINPVAVHNWTFVSLEFAKLFQREVLIEDLIDSAAKAQPSIAKAVARAKAIRALSTGDEDFDETKIRNDAQEVFYLNLGSRLSVIDTSTDEGRRQSRLLAQMCLKHGPHDFDLAVFLLAQQCGLNLTEESGGAAAMAAYMARLGKETDKYLSFLPILGQLGYKQRAEE